jgi:DNA-binding transcriptional regulator YhcF (GntR family)
MFIRIPRRAITPLAEQIAEQIRCQCEEGHLRPGEPLPPARELARQLTVNYHAVCRAYDLLTAEGIMEISADGVRTVAPPTVSFAPAAAHSPRTLTLETVSV